MAIRVSPGFIQISSLCRLESRERRASGARLLWFACREARALRRFVVKRDLDALVGLLAEFESLDRIRQREVVRLDRREVNPGPFQEADRRWPNAGRTDAALQREITHLDIAELRRNHAADVDSDHFHASVL